MPFSQHTQGLGPPSSQIRISIKEIHNSVLRINMKAICRSVLAGKNHCTEPLTVWITWLWKTLKG